ncbi:MAG: cystathionine beta-lyase [Betaproteobacteria bacterium]|nr:MAG: cystathionine beta-lyase [Betaproteobacteria bacterium]TMH89633.1 MAG: cystathionine beta-lyase [Betaproteobacteria bacterium]
MREETTVVHSGLHPERHHGAVNPPVFHASTILSENVAEFRRRRQNWILEQPGTYYGRFGTPTIEALQEAIAALEGGHRTVVYPSGLAACAGALLAFLSAGDQLLMSDTVYGPTRNFATGFLKRFGVSTTFFDPLAGSSIESLIRPETRVIYLESPGSLTFEVQDVPAIAEAAHRRGITVIADNTWGTPLYFKPFAHGVDVSVQAATKYIVGHSDAMLGAITCTKEAWPRLRRSTHELGQTAGPDDVYLGQRGLRTLAVRLKQHWKAGVALAEWIARQPEVERVLHPALPGDPGHAIWKRDFTGACGLFGVVLKEGITERALGAMIDGLELYGIGSSWGGFESLIVPFDPRETRTATKWPHKGPCFRIHAGLENVEDLIADLEAGFERLRST